jgi:hypothetical protein
LGLERRRGKVTGDDPPYGLDDYRCDKAAQSDSDESEPWSTETLVDQYWRWISQGREVALGKTWIAGFCRLTSHFTSCRPLVRHGQENERKHKRKKVYKRLAPIWCHSRRGSVPAGSVDHMIDQTNQSIHRDSFTRSQSVIVGVNQIFDMVQ